jgi:hypothetical protein
MGRTLLLRKDRGTVWDEDAKSIAFSYIDPKAQLTQNPINPRTKRPFTHDPPKIGSLNLQYSYKLARVFFNQIGSEFGCREGLTRDMQNAQRRLRTKDSILLVKEQIVPQEDKFHSYWKEFMKEFLSCLGVEDNVVENFALTSSSTRMVCFPIDARQRVTDGTIASAVVGLIRNADIFIKRKNSRRLGYRTYKEVIKEMIDELESKWKHNKRNNTSVRIKYPIHTSNVAFWHVLHYIGLMPSISKRTTSSRNNSNGPHTFVGTYHGPISRAITGSNKEQINDLLEFVGGADAEFTRVLPSTIRAAILDRARKTK